MKSCPNCQRHYGDEVDFCLEDGTALVAVKDFSPAPEPLTAPLPVSRPTNPAFAEISAAPLASRPATPAVKSKSTAGRALGVLALLIGLFSFGMMVLGLVGAVQDLNSSIVGSLIVIPMFLALLGFILGLVGIIRAVRNDARKAWPVLGILANTLYLLFILAVLVFGLAVSKK
jgi:hypothetical protein